MPTSKTRGSLLNAPEYADRVNLIKKIKVTGSWRFAPVVPEPNGRLKNKVRINGTVETHAEGAYYIEWRERGKRCRVSVAREDALGPPFLCRLPTLAVAPTPKERLFSPTQRAAGSLGVAGGDRPNTRRGVRERFARR